MAHTITHSFNPLRLRAYYVAHVFHKRPPLLSICGRVGVMPQLHFLVCYRRMYGIVILGMCYLKKSYHLT